MKKILTIAMVLLGMAAAGTAQAQIVGASTQRESLIRPKKEVPEYRPTGGFVQFSLGYPFGISVGKQITSSFLLAGGIGLYPELNTWNREDDWSKPLFLQARLSTPKYNFSLFADVKAAIDLEQIINPNDYFLVDNKVLRYPMLSLQLGAAWRDLALGLGWVFFYDEEMWYEHYKSGMHGSFVINIDYRITFDAIRRILL